MKNKVIVLAVKFVSIVILFTIQKLLSKFLDVSQYGQFNFIMALINSFSVLVILGGDRLIINQFSFRNSQFKSELVSNSIHVLTVLTIFVGLLYSLNLDDHKLYFIFGLFFNSLIIIFSSIYRGKNNVIFADIIQKILRPSIFILLLLIFASNQISDTLNLFLISLIPFAFFLFYQYNPFKKVKLNNRKKYIKNGLSMSYFSIILVMLPNLEIYIFGFLDKYFENGIFSLFIKIAAVIPVFYVTINSLLAPFIGKHFKLDEIGFLQNSIIKNNKISFIASILIYIIIIFMSEHILSFFGKEFLEYKLVLICLSTIQLINVFFGPTILIASHSPSRGIIAKKIILSIFLLVTISYFLIKSFGIYGGVASNLISVLVINSIIYVHMIKFYKLKLNSF